MAKIGIDFGTTNSLLVAYDKEKNQFSYTNFDLRFINKPVPTSSTVWYYDQNIIVGSEARENINKFTGIEGHHFEKSIKLKLGLKSQISILGREFKPFKVAADILRHIKRTANEEWQAKRSDIDLNRAIFTVPINFNGIQREALRDAANNAGIEVTTFIHEPFAAIIGYYFTKTVAKNSQEIITELKNLNGRFILTFDWGGGTLDITVVKVENGKMIEIGTAELTGKAGDKFDEDIANWAWGKFLNRYGSKYDEAVLEQKRKDCWDKILIRAESCKIRLSAHESANFTVLQIIDDLDISEQITRADFENLIENTLLEACNAIDKAIKDAHIGNANIDYVLLVGGTTHIPAVQEKLKEKFGHKVITPENSELLIAQGAAVISEMGWLPFLTKDISIQLSDDSLYPIFEQNTPIAADSEATKSEDLVCCDNRGGEAKIIIVEGNEQRKDRNLAILKVPVRNNSRDNDDINLDAIIDRNIILKISAHSKPYGALRQTEVHQLCFGLDFEKGK
jgi:molecular chaperone DnaK